MSSKQRRANAPPLPQPQPSAQQQQQQPVQNSRPVDMTLPQVLQLMETRIRKLEQVKPVAATETTPSPQIAEVVSSWKEFQAEYDSRFNLLVTEINELKDIVMKLQSYTMDVNKTLLEERVHFMADLSEVKENIVMRVTTPIEEE